MLANSLPRLVPRDCGVERDQPEREMAEFSTLCFSPARDLSLSRNLLANQFSLRCPNEESDVAFGIIHFRRFLVCNVSRRRPSSLRQKRWTAWKSDRGRRS